MSQVTSTGYIMEDPREAGRLERKLNADAWLDKYMNRHIFPRAKVLSVGAGPGIDLRAISALHPSVSATGLDISPKRIEQAKERHRDNPRVQFVFGDAQEMQFAADSFDVVYTRMLLQYLPRKEQAVAEMARVCNRGGVVLLQDLDGQLVWHYPEDSIMQGALQTVLGALAQTGFDPFVGRKLFWMAQRAGLEKIEVHVECYHLIAGEAEPSIFEQWDLKLKIARPLMVRSLGSETQADEQIGRFLEYLKRPDTLTYSNVFTIIGRKPL
jgi:ubiquinone/menaquinone biosynthesis C-methylase UbiE